MSKHSSLAILIELWHSPKNGGSAGDGKTRPYHYLGASGHRRHLLGSYPFHEVIAEVGGERMIDRRDIARSTGKLHEEIEMQSDGLDPSRRELTRLGVVPLSGHELLDVGTERVIGPEAGDTLVAGLAPIVPIRLHPIDRPRHHGKRRA